MDDVKINKNNTNLEKSSNDYNEKFDSSLFDETLNKIEETLKILGEEKTHKQILLDGVVKEKKINRGNCSPQTPPQKNSVATVSFSLQKYYCCPRLGAPV